MKAFIEKEVLRLFGKINPHTIQSFIGMLKYEQKFCEIDHSELICETYRLLNESNVKQSQSNQVVSFSIRKEMDIEYSRSFKTSYDWMVIANNREQNAEWFFKLYTMQNDTRDILWHMKHELN